MQKIRPRWLFSSEMALLRRWHLYWELNERNKGTSHSEVRGQSILKIAPASVKTSMWNKVWLKNRERGPELQKHRGKRRVMGEAFGASSGMLSNLGQRVKIWFSVQWREVTGEFYAREWHDIVCVWALSLCCCVNNRLGGWLGSRDQVGTLVAVQFSFNYQLSLMQMKVKSSPCSYAKYYNSYYYLMEPGWADLSAASGTPSMPVLLSLADSLSAPQMHHSFGPQRLWTCYGSMLFVHMIKYT